MHSYKTFAAPTRKADGYHTRTGEADIGAASSIDASVLLMVGVINGQHEGATDQEAG